MNNETRDFAIRDLGCTACWLSGIDSQPCEKHHLNEGDQPGRKRLGEKFTVGLCKWHHTGHCFCTGAITNCDACQKFYGPSWRHSKRDFITLYGDGTILLGIQDGRIDHWQKGNV